MKEAENTFSPTLMDSRVIIPLTSGICLILLAVVLKNVLLVPAQQLSSDMILYIIIYMGFIISYPLSGDTKPGSSTRLKLWIGIIILCTLAIILVYAI